jgi:hypothetical protein
MVIGSDGKWSKALKDAFIQASPAGRVKMPPPAFRALSGRFPGRFSGPLSGAASQPAPGPGNTTRRDEPVGRGGRSR